MVSRHYKPSPLVLTHHCLASLSTFQNLWCSKQEYDESGPGIVHRSMSSHLLTNPSMLMSPFRVLLNSLHRASWTFLLRELCVLDVLRDDVYGYNDINVANGLAFCSFGKSRGIPHKSVRVTFAT